MAGYSLLTADRFPFAIHTRAIPRGNCAPGGPLKTCERHVVLALEQAIAERIGAARFQLWFHDKTRFSWDERELLVGVPNRFCLEWLEKTFAAAVRAAAAAALGPDLQVRFAIDPELYQAARRAEAEEKEPAAPAEKATTAFEKAKPRSESTQLRPRRWRRLEDFVVGACNRLAHAAALSVVEAPAYSANPLVLYGPVGTGKTHLLEGISFALHHAAPEWQVSCVTSELFTCRFLDAMKLGQLTAFRKQFRGCDVLLVDDLHFLARKKVTQEEFLHTFDALLADGKQIVVTCDCHPQLAEEFSPELKDRLLGGPIWGLAPPDAGTRLDILRSKSTRGGPAVPEEVLRFLAEQLRGNVRELEGALHSVRHYSLVVGRAIDLELARQALGELLRHAVRVVQLVDIDRQVCQVLRLPVGALQSQQRSWAVSHPRMLAMFLARKHTSAAHSEIGRYFGGRNHSTVVAAEKKVRQWLEQDGELQLGEQKLRVRELLERIERELHR
jgi:chromosomal replication initiator protein